MFTTKGKTYAGMLACASMLLLATSCSGKPNEPAATEQKPITMHMFSAAGGGAEWFENTYGKYLRAKFPHITFNVYYPNEIKIEDYVATSKDPLDIVFGAYTNFHTAVLNMNLQNDISDLIKKEKYDLNKLEPTVVDLQRQLANGGIYGLPAFIGTSGLYYNKDLFDKFAVSYPTDGMTWDELYELAVKLTRRDGETQYYGFANDNFSYIQVNQLSLDLVDPNTHKASFNTDEWKRVVQMMTKFMTIPGIDITQATVANFNTKGNVAMATNYTGCCGFTPGEAVQNWGVVRIPDFPDKRNVGPQVFPNYWFMSASTKQRDAAFEVIQYVASEEFQKSLNARGLATALKDTALHEKYGQELPKYQGRDMSALFPKPHAKMSNITEYQILAAQKLFGTLPQIVQNGVDVNTAIREAAEATDKEIQAAKESKK